MSDPAGEIEAITAELRTIADRLRSPDLGDEDAERLAREAADLVARAGNELERAQTDSRDE
jgi:hypothetical protein